MLGNHMFSASLSWAHGREPRPSTMTAPTRRHNAKRNSWQKRQKSAAPTPHTREHVRSEPKPSTGSQPGPISVPGSEAWAQRQEANAEIEKNVSMQPPTVCE